MLYIKSTIIVLFSKTLQLGCLNYYVSWEIGHPYLDKDFDFKTLFLIVGKDFR
jgi:hypothetical protein